jgi:hypothetical protein
MERAVPRAACWTASSETSVGTFPNGKGRAIPPRLNGQGTLFLCFLHHPLLCSYRIGHSYTIKNEAYLGKRTVFKPCVLAFIYSLYRFQHNISSRSWLVASGIFLGLAALTRPNGSFLFDLLCLWAALVTFARMMAWTCDDQERFHHWPYHSRDECSLALSQLHSD